MLALLCSVSCTTTKGIIDKQVRPRASFDLNCPEEQLEIQLLSGDKNRGSYGARGCGRRERYEFVCGDFANSCRIGSDADSNE